MPASSKGPRAKKSASGSKYGQGWTSEYLIDLPVPSGALCQVRRPGVAGLIRVGVLDSIDSLTGIVATNIEAAEKGTPQAVEITPEALKELSQNKDKVAYALDLTDKIVEYVVVQPSVIRPVKRDERGKPILDEAGNEIELEPDERVEGQVYTDGVDLMDRMYIFQFVVGGVTDLETFRAEYDESLGRLEGVSSVQGSPE